MDTPAVLEAALSRYVDRHPDTWREEIEFLRSLRVGHVEMLRRHAWVTFENADWTPVLGGANLESPLIEVAIGYLREGGRWKFRGCTLPTLRFMMFASKLEGFLPKRGWPDDGCAVDAVVTIGPEGLTPEGASLLTARLQECLAARDTAWIVLDVAPTASWDSAIRAREAIRELGICENAFAAATTAGPGPGVRVNGIPVSMPYDAQKASIDPAAVERVISLAGHDRRLSEIHLDCPNPDTLEGLPWVLETSFANRGAVPIRAFRMRDGDPTRRLVLESGDPDLVRAHLKAREDAIRAEAEPGDSIIIASPDPASVRVEVAVLGPVEGEPSVPVRVTLRPHERITRIDTIPWRAGEFFVRAEVLDANGRWRSSTSVRLSTLEPGVGRPSPEEVRARAERKILESRTDRAFTAALVSRGEAILRLAASAGDGSDPERHLLALGRISRSDAEPSLRLLAALAAQRIHEKDGLALLQSLTRRTDADPALVEAARRLDEE